MFSYEEFYKLYNTKAEARYLELRAYVEKHVSEMMAPGDKNFRDRMMRYSKYWGEYLVYACSLEEKRSTDYLNYASLQELKEEQKKLYQDLSVEGYMTGFAGTANLNNQAKEVGEALSMFSALFLKAPEEAIKHRRFRLLKLMDLYVELSKRISGKGQVKAESLISLYQDFWRNDLSERESIFFTEHFSPADEYLTDIVTGCNLMEPYYLYEMNLPISETEMGWYKAFHEMDDSLIAEAAASLADSFEADLKNREVQHPYRRYSDSEDYTVKRKVVAIDYPAGCELLAKCVAEKLKEKDYVPFIRHIETQAVSPAYLRDHNGDMMRFPISEAESITDECAEKCAVDNEALLKGFAGTIRILQGVEAVRMVAEPRGKGPGGKPQRLFGRYSVRQSEKKAQEVQALKERFLNHVSEKGQLSQCAMVSMILPAYEASETFGDKLTKYLKLASAKIYAERPQQVLCDALDRGSFVYLAGKDGNETDLLVALHPIRNPQAETNFLADSGAGVLPGGSVYTIPQLGETNGILHLAEANVGGTCFRNLKLVFEEGVICDYSCDNFETEAENRQLIRNKLLRQTDSLPISELAIGTNTDAYKALCEADGWQDLEGLLRRSLMPSIVIGEETPGIRGSVRYNAGNAKTVLSGDAEELKTEELNPAATAEKTEEKAEAKDEEKPEAAVEEAKPEDKAEVKPEAKPEANAETETAEAKPQERRAKVSWRLSIPFESIAQLSVITEEGNRTDIMREGVFVLIGTDRLNLPLLKPSEGI